MNVTKVSKLIVESARISKGTGVQLLGAIPKNQKWSLEIDTKLVSASRTKPGYQP